jgi:hypothetical protein
VPWLRSQAARAVVALEPAAPAAGAIASKPARRLLEMGCTDYLVANPVPDNERRVVAKCNTDERA